MPVSPFGNDCHAAQNKTERLPQHSTLISNAQPYNTDAQILHKCCDDCAALDQCGNINDTHSGSLLA